MDDGPLAVGFGLDGDGLHGASAGRGPVARAVVDVSAEEARGAVVAVFGAPAFARDAEFAVDARKAVGLVTPLAPVVVLGHMEDDSSRAHASVACACGNFESGLSACQVGSAGDGRRALVAPGCAEGFT